MRAVLRTAKLERRSSCDYLLLMLDIDIKDIAKREDLRLALDKREHIDRAGVLKLSIFIKLVENYLTVSVAAVLNDDSHTVLARLVADVGDSLDPLVLDKLTDRLTKLALIYLIRNLGEDDAVLFSLDLSLCSYHYASLTRSVRLLDSSCAVNCCGGREVGALDVLHKLADRAFGVVDTVFGSLDYLGEIMRRYVGRHTYRDTDRSVYKKVGEL